ncbi:hypothetical protein JTB14_011220 [Gonioctena quinquepunctata]|nr:hypothetical protein JTB14_011220 [Gonioctena quinquepunctata]
MYLRPKPCETEEDLLRLQEEFERNKAESKLKPAATFVSNKTDCGNTTVKNEQMETCMADIQEQLANTFEAIPSDMKLKEVTEKNTLDKMPAFRFNKERGFPVAKRRDVHIILYYK